MPADVHQFGWGERGLMGLTARHEEGRRLICDSRGEVDRHVVFPGDIEEPEWVYWMSRDEIDVMAGRCLIELGDPTSAAPLLTVAIANYDATLAREVALYRTWLAESFARTGELDEARTMIEKARAAADGMHSVRLGRRVEEIEDLIRLAVA